jgi:NADPH:quinone reductase-like Zn-dependent oxidoreductase
MGNQVRQLLLDLTEMYQGWSPTELKHAAIAELIFWRTRGKVQVSRDREFALWRAWKARQEQGGAPEEETLAN